MDPVATRDGETAPRRLIVMTYNIRHGQGFDGVVDLGRIAAVIEAAAPDGVALQEVDCGRPRSRAADQAGELGRRLGMDSRFHACMVLGPEQYGIATLSRLPVREDRRIALPAHGRGRSEPRYALSTTIEWAGEPIEIVNTHLSVLPGERPDQVERLLAHIDQHTDLVLGGDLNMWTRSSTFRRLLGAVRDARPRGRSWPARLPLVRLDHLLYRGRLAVVGSRVIASALARRASDHLPLIATFEGYR
jgi:endonuclease/exonuclease/phosphatase family metal-dependent hydrolase